MKRRAVAQAAVWVARLHGPTRSRVMEAEFRAWLAASKDHREAFERCTEAWEAVPALSLAQTFGVGQGGHAGRRAPGLRWVAAMLAALALLGMLLRSAGDIYTTGIGEYRQVVLPDGSRIRLNTATQVEVQLSADGRQVELRAGEALFEVAKEAARPFVVRAADSEVRALGTAFAVRLVPDAAAAQVAVTLLEGRVEVSHGASGERAVKPLVLVPGERVQMGAGARPVRLDRPALDRVVAWTREQIVLDDVPLREALAEVNRYSRQPIRLAQDSRLQDLRVSGIYRTGDPEGFARTVAALYGLTVRLSEDVWLLEP